MARAEEHGDRSRRESRHEDQVVRPGTLLVSATDLVEPSFRRSVVYILEHNDGGTWGVVLNKPSDTPLNDVLPAWSELAAGPRALYIGGPVKRDAALCLATIKVGASIAGLAGVRRVDGRVALIDLDSDPDTIEHLVEGVRVFAGYAGWTFGQLEGELDRGDWIVLSALPSDPLAGRGDLWAQVLRRQPLPLSLLATHPIELERN
ncbi:YqgE/AlgH family protein [Nocardia yunnanensis]|uniref:YqgE/AlgH family protein n=1 Tax=Nocardia yunnanensis TaxID=2382165 RepID=A0A386ZEE1_9NOCA|nr:YqgE/AlgH family protein [Nocardia yunnanensis]AYF76011.1 YqgE/AlgH family protein [Nocardia yunnanensis]